MNSRLHIGNLSPAVTEDELRLLFSRAGTVSKIEFMLDPVNSQPRGFAFVTMATPESAAMAMSNFHCYSLGGRYITVTEARPPQELKGLMSEGFGSPSASFRPDPQRRENRRRPRGPSKHRGRDW
jgi:cold-inducible RNA-binding protein